ncbi:hypothetical protein DFP81_103311 [Marinomonas pollencensis]|uniref:Uncharacterized protein n=1 Tax=Marinomonas pollencensis TaxID=491954 RepID=A0A3E0DT21_9GAMM|nr:hypothetical protein DFP81_103311 [Marinomonas pollencensis]
MLSVSGGFCPVKKQFIEEGVFFDMASYGAIGVIGVHGW